MCKIYEHEMNIQNDEMQFWLTIPLYIITIHRIGYTLKQKAADLCVSYYIIYVHAVCESVQFGAQSLWSYNHAPPWQFVFQHFKLADRSP